MEIRPYRSQVRATPTPEPTERPNTARGQAYAAWGDAITRTGQTVSNSLYQWDDAIEKRREQDDKVELMAFEQQALDGFDKVNINLKSYFDELAKDPYKVFDYDAKDAADKIYTNEIENLRHSTLDNIKNPRIRQQAELYFKELKMKTGAETVAEIEKHRNEAAAFVYGKSIGLHIDNAVAGDEETRESETVAVLKDLRSMVEMGIMGEAELDGKYKAAKDQIEFGRARNMISSLDYMAGKKYLQQLTKDKPLDDGMRKAVEDYFDEYWRHEADMMRQTAADTFHNDIENVDSLSEEDIRNNPAYKQMPQIGVSNNYVDLLLGMKKKNADHELAEKQKGIIENYFQQIFNPDNDMYGKFDEIEKSVIDNPDLTTPQKEDILRDIKSARDGKAGSGKGLSDTEIKWGDSYYLEFMDEYYQILTMKMASPQQKEKMFAEFCSRHYVPPEKYSTLLNALNKSFTNPRLKSVIKFLDMGMQGAEKEKDIYKYDMWSSVAETMYGTLLSDTTAPDGSPLPQSEIDRKIDIALDVVDTFINGQKLDDLAKTAHLPNNPVVVPKNIGGKRDYSIELDMDFDYVLKEAEAASLLRDTPYGRNLYDQYINAFGDMVDAAVGHHVNTGMPVFMDNSIYLEADARSVEGKDGRMEKYVPRLYRIFKNDNGNVNVEMIPNDGVEEPELVIPSIARKDWVIRKERDKSNEEWMTDYAPDDVLASFPGLQ